MVNKGSRHNIRNAVSSAGETFILYRKSQLFLWQASLEQYFWIHNLPQLWERESIIVEISKTWTTQNS